MSITGISEALRWDAVFRQTFTREPAALVTDDLGVVVNVMGMTAQLQYQYAEVNGLPWWRIVSDVVPGQSIWYHERGHRINAYAGEFRVAWLRELFKLRGAAMPGDELLADEQAASMLPEAFLGVWAGYPHPIWGSNPDPALVAAYATTTQASQVRSFLLRADGWQPSAQDWYARRSLRFQTEEAMLFNAVQLNPIPDSNYRVGRLAPVEYLIFHHMAGTVQGADARFRSRDQVSAHLGVTRDIGNVMWVSLDDTAYAAGGTLAQPALDPLINDKSVNVEVEDFGTDSYSSDQIERCAIIAAAWSLRYQLPLDGVHVIGHGSVPGVATACPGSFPLDFVLARAQSLAQGDEDMTPEQERKLNAIYEALYPGADGESVFGTITAGFNVTMKLALRRIARGLGGKRDPFVGYPDDETPISG